MTQKNPPFKSKPRSRDDYYTDRRSSSPRQGEERRTHSGTRSGKPFRPPYPKREGERGDRPYRPAPRSNEEGHRPYRSAPRSNEEGQRPFRYAPKREEDRENRPRRSFPKRENSAIERPRRYRAPGQYENRNEHRDQESRNIEHRTIKLRPRKSRQLKEVIPVVRERRQPLFDKEEMRLNKYISNSGICSRREADEYITAGLVSVNGEIVTRLGSRVKPTDDIRFNGERLMGEEKVYIVMNKPKDFVTTTDDPHAEQTVLDLIAEKCPQRVYPVGRLDKSSTGVLLLTNDGALTEQLTHPSYNRKKIYQVDLDKNLKQSDMAQLVKGVDLEDGPAYMDEISYIDENEKKIGVEIHSGRNRIVRRMFEHLGYTVKKLDRVYFAGLTKKKLRRGAWRFLTPQEVTMLKMGSYE